MTSTSLMVRWLAAPNAAAYARQHPTLSVGLHFDLGEWLCVEGEWRPTYEVVDKEDDEAVARELTRQLASFRKSIGRDPTHLDSHQHVHLMRKSVRSTTASLAKELGITARVGGAVVKP